MLAILLHFSKFLQTLIFSQEYFFFATGQMGGLAELNSNLKSATGEINFKQFLIVSFPKRVDIG